MSSPKYKRILLKLSGEVLMGKQPYGIDLDTVSRLADEDVFTKELNLVTAAAVRQTRYIYHDLIHGNTSQ